MLLPIQFGDLYISVNTDNVEYVVCHSLDPMEDGKNMKIEFSPSYSMNVWTNMPAADVQAMIASTIYDECYDSSFTEGDCSSTSSSMNNTETVDSVNESPSRCCAPTWPLLLTIVGSMVVYHCFQFL